MTATIELVGGPRCGEIHKADSLEKLKHEPLILPDPFHVPNTPRGLVSYRIEMYRAETYRRGYVAMPALSRDGHVRARFVGWVGSGVRQ